MHDLDRQLAAWKGSIARARTLTEDDIAELEVHLRDSVHDLSARGLSQEEALLVALRRIGDPSVLAVEYQKVNPGLVWARRWYWMTAGFLGFSVAIKGIEALSYTAAWLALPEGSAGVAWFLGLAGYAGLALGMFRSARIPGGRLARTLQAAASVIEQYPIATSVAGFACLLALPFAGSMVRMRVLRGLEDPTYAMLLGGALVGAGMPMLLFLLGRYVNPSPDVESALNGE